MTFASRITGALTALSGRAAPLEQKASVAQAISMSLRVGQAQWPPSDYRKLAERYATNPIVYGAIAKIAAGVGEIVPLVKIVEVSGRRRGDPAEDHPIAKAIDAKLARPNLNQGRAEWIGQLAAFDALHGNAFVEQVAVGGEVVELWAPRPDRFQIIPARDGGVAAYRYEDAGRKADFASDPIYGRADILHIRRFAALDDLWGVGCLKPAARDLAVYDAAQDLSKAMFDNAATPSGALTFKPSVSPGAAMPTLSQEQFDRLKAQIEARYSGPKNAGRPLLLDGGLEWQQMGMSMVDMGAEAIRNEAGRGIARAFGVPPMLLGIPGDNTYSNYQEANRAFYRETIIPTARRLYGRLAAWLTAWLSAKFPVELQIDIDPEDLWALQDEVQAKWQRITGGQNAPPLTPNEMREALGYDPIEPSDEPGDQVWTSNFNVPLSATIRSSEAAADQAQIQVQQMLQFPGFDPSKDRDGDGVSNEGTGASAGAQSASSSVDGKG